MLRALLAERFNFKGHYESQAREFYNLVLARPDAGLPAGLRKVNVDCEARRDANVRGEKPPELPRAANGAVPCSISMSYGSDSAGAAIVRSGGRTMAEFAQTPLSGIVNRVVRDNTGLQGYYEFEMRFTENPQPSADLPSAFTALQEQLGLKLESARGPVRVFVIDHLDRPSEN